jgi:hypothetical protein
MINTKIKTSVALVFPEAEYNKSGGTLQVCFTAAQSMSGENQTRHLPNATQYVAT